MPQPEPRYRGEARSKLGVDPVNGLIGDRERGAADVLAPRREAGERALIEVKPADGRGLVESRKREVQAAAA